MTTIVIAEFDQETMFCYDIYADGSVDLKDIIGVIVDEKIMEVKFGFTPDKKYDCRCEKSPFLTCRGHSRRLMEEEYDPV